MQRWKVQQPPAKRLRYCNLFGWKRCFSDCARLIIRGVVWQNQVSTFLQLVWAFQKLTERSQNWLYEIGAFEVINDFHVSTYSIQFYNYNNKRQRYTCTRGDHYGTTHFLKHLEGLSYPTTHFCHFRFNIKIRRTTLLPNSFVSVLTLLHIAELLKSHCVQAFVGHFHFAQRFYL